MCEPSEKSLHYSECMWISELANQVRDINYFILIHTISRSIFNRHSPVKLLKVAETRFASNTVMATGFSNVKEVLINTVVDADWKKFRVNGKTPVELKDREVKETLLSDAWWDKLEYLLNFTEPMVDFLRVTDKDSCVLHLVYDMWDNVIDEVKVRALEHEGLDLKTGQSTFFDAIQQLIETRWNKSNTPLHCLAHSLVPKYYSEEWL
ncbi:uncharacterized protein LOC141658651 [Silene latifolia]|uniref:uncharacterized protein LOC141658651 n=1 Tax=Silene latifolia TaxID=37657 RepID=UPI003D76DA7B